jgi:hypothetical protein
LSDRFTDRRGVANRIEPIRFQIVREIPPQRREPILMLFGVIDAYKVRFRQQTVGIITCASCAAF